MDTTAEAGKLCQFDKVVTTGDYHGEVGDDDDDDDSDDGDDDDDDVIDSAFLYMICSLDVERCSLRGQGRRQECLARACRIEERLAHQPLYSCRGCVCYQCCGTWIALYRLDAKSESLGARTRSGLGFRV